MVVIVDDEDRENEGDLIMAAELVRPQDINFMVTHARGLVCLSLTRERCRQLGLPPMVRDNTSSHGTNFTVSIEAAEGVTTGISAYDRAHTIRTAVRPDASARDLSQPGHIFPLQAQPGGVLNRAGHTEAASDLALLAGLEPAGVLVEILNPDGSMARRPELEVFAREHGLKIGSIEDLIRHRLATEHTIERVDERDDRHRAWRVRAAHLSRPPEPCAAFRVAARRRRCRRADAGARAHAESAGRRAALAARRISAPRSATCSRAIAREGRGALVLLGERHGRRCRCSRASANSPKQPQPRRRTRPNGAATAPVRRSSPTSAWASCACSARRAGRSVWPATGWKSSNTSIRRDA